MMAYLFPYLLHYFLPFLLYTEFKGKPMAPFCFCCFLCCLPLCFALPGKPTIKARSWGQAWYLLLHHCHPVSGEPCYKPAAVLALLRHFLGRVKHLSLLRDRYFQPCCNDHSVPQTSLLNQMWAVNLSLFSLMASQMVGAVTQVCPEAVNPWVATAGTPWSISSSARGHAGTPESMCPWISPQQNSYTPRGLQPWVKLCWRRFLLKDCDHG